MLWIAFQKFGTMIISFSANIVLARVLMPSDFGTLGILMSFIAFSEIFIDGGLTSSLIQKGKPTNEDFSSVFFFNIVISVAFYILIYALAPSISDFFGNRNLTNSLRVIGIILIINALSIIQLTKLQIQLNFKDISLYNMLGNILGVAIGIFLALMGWGIWSLVYKTIVTQLSIAAILWHKSNWKPNIHFSFRNILSLYKFGGYIFISTFIEYLYTYLQPILIGKFFSMSELGYFSQARKVEEIPTNSLVSVTNTVTFPIYSQLSNDIDKMVENARKTLKYLSFFSFPLMTFLIISSENVILLLFGEKWLDAYPLLQILCIAGMFRIPSGSNMNLIKSIGKSKSFMYIQILKRILGILCIFIGFHWGIIGLMWGFAFAGVSFFFVDSFVCGHYIQYGVKKQIMDMLGSLLISFVTGAIVYILGMFMEDFHYILNLIVKLILFLVGYLVISKYFNSFSYSYYQEKVKSFIRKR